LIWNGGISFLRHLWRIYISSILTIFLSFYDAVVYRCLKESGLFILKLLGPPIRIIRRWFLELGVFMRKMFYKG
jgi:hypothetical protein